MKTSQRRHEPAGYRCPFCAFLRGEWDERNAATDLVVRRELVFARIAPKWWPVNDGGVLVIPNEHVENGRLSGRVASAPARPAGV